MAKKRLNNTHRSILIAYAKEQPLFEKELKAAEKAEQDYYDLLMEEVDKAFPEEDMKILRKYDQLARSTYVNVQWENGYREYENFQEGTERGLPAGRKNLKGSKKLQTARKKAIELRDHYDKEREKILNGYRALVNTSRYYEDVLEAWPAAEACATQILAQSTSLVAVSEDTLAMIRNTNLGAKE